jgi:hypothetical protein
MKHTSDFQRSFLARGTGNTLFTQKEFDDAVAIAKAEIMQIAIDTTKTAIALERQECANLVKEWAGDLDLAKISTAIQYRMNK